MHFVKNLSTFLLWTAIISLSVYFFLDNVWAFVYGYRSKNFGTSFFNNQFWVVAHLVGGSIAMFLGPVQFWKWVRNANLHLHRLSGKIYMAGAFITGLSALRLSVVSYCVPCRISLFLLAIFLLFTTTAAWYSVKNKNIKAHRQFMVRSYVVLLSFVAVRIDGLIPLDFLFGHIGDPLFKRVVNEYFFSFVPLLTAEILMTWIPSLKRRKVSKSLPTHLDA
jgi:uncharacterized membrane protein